MKYFLKTSKGIQGPFALDEIKEKLIRLEIGTKTLCKTDEPESKFEALSLNIPELFGNENENSNLSVGENKYKQKKYLNDAPDYKIDSLGSDLILTTETCLNDLNIVNRLGIVSGEVALGINVFKDIFTELSDVFGGKSKTLQRALAAAKRDVLTEIKREALKLEANAVIAINFGYNQFSGGGKSMIFMVGFGTAALVKKNISKDFGGLG